MKNDDEDSSLRVNGLWKASRGWWKTGASRVDLNITSELQQLKAVWRVSSDGYFPRYRKLICWYAVTGG